MEKNDTIAMTIRIPLEVRIQLQKLARHEQRSVNGTIIYILQEYFDKKKKS